MYVRTWVCMHLQHMYLCMHVFICVCMYVYMYICMYVYVYICVYICMCVCFFFSRQGLTGWIRSNQCYRKMGWNDRSDQNEKCRVQTGMTSYGVVMCIVWVEGCL